MKKNKLKKFAVLFLVISACWMAQQSEATMLIKKDFDSLVQEADGIIVGTVKEVKSFYDANFEIFTFVTMADLEVVSGNYPGEEFTIRLKGGQIDGEFLELEGSPHFNTGEHVVLFVKGNGKLAVPIVGWTQGVLRVVSSENRLTVMDYDGNRILGVKSGEFQKEIKNVSETTFIDPKTGAIVSEDIQTYQSDGHEATVSKMISRKREASAGQPDDAAIPEKETSLSKEIKKESLTLDELKNAIIQKAKTKVHEAAFLESADARDLDSPADQDGILKGQEKSRLSAPSEQTEVEPFLPKPDKIQPVGEDAQPAQQKE